MNFSTKYSPIEIIHKKVPKVITVHGTDDTLVPYKHALRLDEALKPKHVLITVDGGEHWRFSDEEHLEIKKQIDENLDIECKLNGETVQKSNTSDLIFNVSSIISYLSEIVSLNIGDTIWTGTPSGVGIASGKFLKDGDVLTSSIEGLGSMENKCVRVSDHSRANIVPEFMKGFLKD